MKKLNGHVMECYIRQQKRHQSTSSFTGFQKFISHGWRKVTMFCLTCDKLGVPRPVCVQNDYSLNNRTFDEVPLAQLDGLVFHEWKVRRVQNSVKAGVFPFNGDPLKRCARRNFDLKICKISGNNSVVLWNCQASQRFQRKKVSPFKLLPVNFIVGIFVLKNHLFVLKDVYLQ